MVGIAIDIIGYKSHKQSHKLEVARAILIINRGTGGGINKRKMYHRCLCHLYVGLWVRWQPWGKMLDDYREPRRIPVTWY